MKKFLLLVLFGLSILNAQVVVNKKTRTADGVGTGLSREEAVSNAISEACGQLNGVSIQKKTVMENLSIESSNGDKSTFKYNGTIDRVTKGRVDSYRIEEVFKDDNGLYEAHVTVSKTKVTKRYKTPGHKASNRRSVAVVPSYSGKQAYNVLGRLKSPRDISQRITQELVSSITKTRKFTVLDREANQAYANEKSLLLSRDAGKDEILKLGNVLGADYLFLTNISEFRVENETSTLSITGESETTLKAYVTVQYRIVAMATRQIKWSNTSTFEFEPSGNTADQIYLDVLKKVSGDLTYELIENIYPIKVTGVSANGELILNQGTLSVGSQYDIFKLGKKLYDSYTKEYLGRDEIHVGKIEIARSLSKISYAKVVSGDVKKGNICRKIKSNNNLDEEEIEITEADKPSDVQQIEGGGVVLPF